MKYKGDWIILERKTDLQGTLYCECGNPFNTLEGICPRCKKKWYYKVQKPRNNKKRVNLAK